MTTTAPDLKVVAGTDLDFATYVAARRPALLRFAWSVTGDPHTAEDVLQTSLVRVLARWETLRDKGAADAYLRRTIVRQHVSWHRQPWRHGEVSTAHVPDRAGAVGPAEAAGADELWALVRGLPEQQRATVVLRYYEQLSIAETAAVLGCSTGTVKSNAHRALAALRRRADCAMLAG
ncbi:SigE family RNA polymerase sigma factor [Mycobacterium cookii]|uniref:SigE family RNA polymerase sigma factor n=1 Tax=Nocardioides furvisabuli TaxID=375542 RepID=A0ABP5IP93_9ACTN|nr:SigE family RNA polymerase sigma factor [Nocardioides furvisabuli]